MMHICKYVVFMSIVIFFSGVVCFGEQMAKDAKIYVAGAPGGLVGSAIVRQLTREKFTNIIVRTRQELDLCDQQAVHDFFAAEKPDYVFLAAAKVGGIKANIDYPADFIYDNVAIEMNVIHAAYIHGVKKLLFLGSSCIFPRNCPQPIKEEYFLTGPLEKTNEPYAIAKIAGIILCQAYNRQFGTNFISCMPTNLYGPGDNFDLETSHVLPALLAKIYQAEKENQPEVVVWGTGKPYREFLYVNDFARIAVFLMNRYNDSEIINVGTGQDITIMELAELIRFVVGYKGSLVFDTSKPDGTPRKLLNVNKLKAFGWGIYTPLEEGIRKTLQWYKTNVFAQ